MAWGGARVVRFPVGCAGCAAQGLCRSGEDSAIAADLLNLAHLPTGARVDLSVSERGLNSAALGLFGAPLAALIGAAAAAGEFAGLAGWNPHLAAPVAGAGGFLLALGVARRRAAALLAALDPLGQRVPRADAPGPDTPDGRTD